MLVVQFSKNEYIYVFLTSVCVFDSFLKPLKKKIYLTIAHVKVVYGLAIKVIRCVKE